MEDLFLNSLKVALEQPSETDCDCFVNLSHVADRKITLEDWKTACEGGGKHACVCAVSATGVGFEMLIDACRAQKLHNCVCEFGLIGSTKVLRGVEKCRAKLHEDGPLPTCRCRHAGPEWCSYDVHWCCCALTTASCRSEEHQCQCRNPTASGKITCLKHVKPIITKQEYDDIMDGLHCVRNLKWLSHY